MRQPLRAGLIGAGAAAFALAILLWGLDRPAFWLDEITTVAMVQRDGLDFVKILFGHEAIHAPYYVLMKPWVAISADEGWVRLFSALCAAAAAGLLAAWTYRRAGWAAAIATGGILMTFPAFSRYGQDARSYALIILAGVISVIAFGRLSARADRRSGLVYSASVAALALLHVLNVFVPSAHVLTELITGGAQRWDRVLRTVRWALLGLVVAAPWALLAFLRAQGVGKAPTPGPARWLYMARFLLGNETVLILVVALSLLALADLRSPERHRLVVLAAAWAYGPTTLILLGGFVRPSILIPRYLIASLPGVALLAGLGCAVLVRLVAVVLSRLPRPIAVLPALAVAVAPAIAIAALTYQRQVDIREADGHGDDVRPLLSLLDHPDYRSLPVAAPQQAQRTVLIYAPEAAPRMLIAQDAAAAGQLNTEDLEPAQARRILAPYDRVLFFLWSPRPEVEDRTRAAETQLSEFRPVKEHRVKGWLLLVMERRP